MNTSEYFLIIEITGLLAVYFMYRGAEFPDKKTNVIKPVSRNKKGVRYYGAYDRIITRFAFYPINIGFNNYVFLCKYKIKQRYIFHRFWGWRWKNIDKWRK